MIPAVAATYAHLCADLIDRRGLAQGQLTDLTRSADPAHPALCADAAIIWVAAHPEALGADRPATDADVDAARIWVEDTLCDHVDGNYIGWNDVPGRTATEVADAFRHVHKQALTLAQATPQALQVAG